MTPALLAFASLLSVPLAGPAPGASPPKLVVLEVRATGLSAEESAAINGALPVRLADLEAFDVLAAEDVRRMLELEGDKRLLGCEDDGCIAEIADALGATLVVYGDASKLGQRVLLNLSLFDKRKARSLKRVSVEAAAAEDLPDHVAIAAARLARPVLGPAGRDRSVDMQQKAQAALEARVAARATAPPAATPTTPAAQRAPTPPGPRERLLVLAADGATAPAEARAALDAALPEKLGALDAFDVLAADEVGRLLELEGDKQLVGCTDEGCLAEIAGALGARLVVIPKLSSLGEVTLLSLSLFDADAARALARVSVRIEAPEDVPEQATVASTQLAEPLLDDEARGRATDLRLAAQRALLDRLERRREAARVAKDTSAEGDTSAKPTSRKATREKLLVLDVQGPALSPETTSAINGTLPVRLSSLDAFDVIAARDVQRLLELEGDKKLIGCEDDSCLAEVAGALGARLVVFSDATRLGGALVVNLSLFDADEARSLQRVSARAERAEDLPDELAVAAYQVVDPVLDDAARDRAADLRLSAERARLARAEARAAEAEAERRARAEAAAAATARTPEGKLALAGPGGPPVFVVDPTLVRLPNSVGTTALETIGKAATDEGLRVFTANDARDILAREADLAQIGGDADMAALAEVGKATGVDHLLAFVVSSVEGETVVQARLIDAPSAAVLSRREARASEHGGMVGALEAATRLALAPIFAHLKGTLALDVTEEGANVLLDGEQIGVTPLDERPLPGGSHLLTVSKEGFIQHQETVRVDAGARIERRVVLRPSPEFLEGYVTTAWIYRGLALGSTALAACAVPVVVGGALGWAYAWYRWDALNQDRARYDEQDLEDRERAASALAEQRQLEALGPVASIVGLVGLTLLGGGGSAATFFWAFGDDPGRYDDLLDERASE